MPSVERTYAVSTRMEPLSIDEEQRSFFARRRRDGSSGNVVGAAWVVGPVDVDALRRAVDSLAARHDELRASLVEHEGSLVRVVYPEVRAAWCLSSVPESGSDRASVELAALALAEEEVSRAFDDDGPWFRACLVRLARDHHLLVLTMHRVLVDEGAVGSILDELASFYARAEPKGVEPTAPPIPPRRGAFQSEHLAFWREVLEGAKTSIEIPTDRPRRPTPEHEADSVEWIVEAELAATLRAIADQGVDPYVVVAAGFQALLHRYTGHSEFVFGVRPPKVRARATHAPPFASYAIRCTITEETTFAALVADTDRALEQALTHLPPPVEAFPADLVRSRQPLFQVLFTEEECFHGAGSAGPVTFDLAPLRASPMPHELRASIRWEGDRLVFGLEFARELFDREFAVRLLGHLESLLRSAIRDGEQKVSELELLPAEERRQILVEWNDTAVALRPGVCVHQLFEEQVLRTPDVAAVVFGERSLTYRELNRDADRLSRHLRRLGVGPDVLVGICIERSIEMAVGLLAILKAGGAYVPLDPAYPRERLGWILADTCAPVLLTERALVDALPDHCAEVIYLDEPLPPDSPEDLAPVGVGPDHLGYVIYTSGSTGRPKGICLPHAALVNLIRWHDRTLLRAARTLQFASLSFDASFHEMFAAWSSGGTVYLITEGVRRDVTELTRFIFEHAIEKVILPVVVLQQMAEHHGAEPHLFGSLKELTTTGEQLHVTRPIAALFQQLPGCAFHNHYGPSETHVVTAYTLTGDPDGWPTHPSIGKAIDNTELYILDRHGQPVPCGVTGELFIGGVCLAREYLGRPDLTAERFVAHPFRDDPAARLYKTGDLARYLRDGNIEFLGRIDHQVKIRGFRIELGEIEGTLTKHSMVKEAVVLAREDTPGDRRLVAYVVPEDAAGADSELVSASVIPALRAHLKAQLPDYMLPSAFVTLPAMPLTPNGKVHRRALPPPGSARPEFAQPYVAPRGALEADLAAIWAQALGLDCVGVLDNFFELGGDSLRAVQVFARVRQRFGVDVSFQILFASPTVAAFADRIDEAAKSGTSVSAIAPTERGGVLPLSFAQERLWFLHRLAPESPAYNCPYFFRLRGRLDSRALEAGLESLVGRHEILRTTFPEIGGQPFQQIQPRLDVRLELLDLRTSSPEARDEALARQLAAFAGRPFDLVRGPLIRAGVIRLDDEEHVLCLNVHHIVTDGRSMEVAFRELASVYGAIRTGEDPKLPAQPIQYADFSAWQRRELTEEVVEGLVAWWRERLVGAPPLLELPADHPRPPVQSFRGEAVPFHLDAALTARLRTLGTHNNMTLVMVVLAGFGTLLHRLTDEDDVIVGIPSLGRDRVELETLLGFFVNTLPVRIDFAHEPSFETLLRRVREASLAAFEHDALPFERLVQELRVERVASHSPIVQVAIAPQPPGERDLRLAGLSVEHLEGPSQRAVFDLTLFCWETPGGLAGTIEYSTDLFERPTIERLVGHLLTLLAGAAAEPTTVVGKLPMLTAEEERRILRDWNDTAAPHAEGSCFHELFAAQSTRTPDAVAVVEPSGRALSYAELDARTNTLARYLRDLGVGPDALVAIAVERSLDLVVGILGILKAGGGYLPLDPTYPRDRLEYMLSDAAPIALVTEAHLEAVLPAFAGPVVRLDADADAIARRSAAALPRTAEPHHLAYVIYTSGSTGRPKGAMIEHRNLVNMAEAQRLGLSMTPDARVLQFSSISFDAAVWEMATTLTIGATLCLLPRGRPPLGVELGRLLRDLRVTVATLPPSVLPDIPPDYASALTTLVVAGEACSAELVAKWAPGRRFINAYGPTECTVCATLAICAPNEMPPPIGRPLANVSVYVLDRHGKPAPIGVSGELHIGGAGVGRGYLNRPGLTAERFLPDPFASSPDARMYRTGDVVRYRSDGNIEFLGRRDDQVKIRGFRIELGEIESALRDHESVHDVAVLARADVPGDRRLVAYVVPAKEAADAAPERSEPGGSSDLSTDAIAQHVSSWQALYDDMFHGLAQTEDGASNFTGWNSSYTGQPIPLDEMRAWRDQTVERILALEPAKVWEIGCGTGLLLLHVAPRIEAYHGTDISEGELTLLRPEVQSRGLHNVTLELRRAEDFGGVAPRSYDMIVLNSVMQYFPDLRYLRSVIRGAVATVGAGGAVFLGDVRSYPLLEAFRASVELSRAPGGLAVADLRSRTKHAIATEPELLVHPEFFHRLREELPEIAHVEVSLKRGRDDNELVSYRYDVVLFVDSSDAPVTPASRRFAEVGAALSEVERWLVDETPDAAELLAVPNARVSAATSLALALADAEGTVAELTERIRTRRLAAVHPDDLWELGERLGYSVRITWSRSGGPACMDVLFERAGTTGRPRPWMPSAVGEIAPASFANDPLDLAAQRSLPARLRSFLDQKLPGYMVPSDFVVMDSLPLSPNGKVDRKALPAPAAYRSPAKEGLVPPRNDLERKLAAVWSELLGVAEIGVHDSFFDLGGHSLMVSRVIFRIQDELGTEVPMRALYEAPTIAQIAELIERQGCEGATASLCYTPSLRLDEEARLDGAIDASAPPVDLSRPSEHVFLTGATGFVGAHLLAELLRTTDARIHCLVRAGDPSQALERLRKNLATYGLRAEALASRVQPVLGDLGSERMGLDPATFERLARTVDAILHNGAMVDHVRGYATMKPANVLGTHEALRLATTGRLKPIHFISTLGTLHPPTHMPTGRVREDAIPGPLGLLPNGYMQSKCVAEHLVLESMSRGIPAAIYRLGAITGHSVTGACNPNDFTYSALRSTIQLGFADNLDTDLTITPVDFAATAIIALFRRSQSVGKAFHVTNPRPMFWLGAIELLRRRGHSIEVRSYAECMAGILDVARRGIDTPMLAFLPFITQRKPGTTRYVAEDYHAPVQWDCENTLTGLTEMGLEGPSAPERLIALYVDYLERHKLL